MGAILCGPLGRTNLCNELKTHRARVRLGIAAAVWLTLSLQGWAQPAAGTGTRSFEVVSIHRNMSGGQNTGIDKRGGRITVTNGSMKTLLRNAYDLQSFQFANEPGWLDSDMFDIVATTGSGDDIPLDQLKEMLRNLLADRFKLRFHWETRQGPVYALVVAKDGPKLKTDADGPPRINGQRDGHRGSSKGTAAPIALLASNLSNQVKRIVIDKTGLIGTYDWMLAWDPEPAEDSTAPSIFTAVQEQLGLKLEAQKGPVETLVIDNAERPTEN
jgi:uncharacterized protein (TIGR03435 family)